MAPVGVLDRTTRESVMKILVLTGAGISAESGLGTFRDKGGLWSRFDPMKLATPEAFAKTRSRFTPSTISAAGTSSMRSPTPPISRSPGWRRRWPSAATS
jgi:NAD-dependent SIR2 family protein deacetylase